MYLFIYGDENFMAYVIDNYNKYDSWDRAHSLYKFEINGRWYFGTPKTVNSIRNVHINSILYSILVKYKNLRIPYRLEGVTPPSNDEVRHAKYLLGVIKDVA